MNNILIALIGIALILIPGPKEISIVLPGIAWGVILLIAVTFIGNRR